MGGFKKGFHIARDQDGTLWAYIKKPQMYIDPITEERGFVSGGNPIMQLPKSWFKHIKFENSPVFVPLTEDFVEQFIKK